MKEPFLSIELVNEEVLLLPQKALFRPYVRQLIVSDVHLGKTSHFRKAGIPLSPQGQFRDIDRLAYLFKKLEPDSVLFLGDLFHSHYNREWLHFKGLLKEHAHIHFMLVEGNHDVLEDEHYNIPNLERREYIEETDFIFSHHPQEEPHKLNICGHIHPGITLDGPARQSISLPCFYHTKEHFVLPAFGSLTGIYPVERIKENDYYVVYNTTIRHIR